MPIHSQLSFALTFLFDQDTRCCSSLQIDTTFSERFAMSSHDTSEALNIMLEVYPSPLHGLM